MIPSSRNPRRRPSPKELTGKIREGLELLRGGKWRPADAQKLQANWYGLESEFGMETATLEDQLVILATVMNEIRPAHYRGQRPPQKSYEPSTRDLELLAFRWASPLFGATGMYFKFAIGGAGDTRRLWIYSLHTSGDEHGG